jgi:hypothetical protein
MVDSFATMLGEAGPDWNAITQPVPMLNLQ